MSSVSSANFSGYQKLVLLILALLQFSIVLDFMIIAPIGDILIKTLNINTVQFGLVVSSYAFSAAISGIAAAGFIDKYDRKKALLVFLVGFILGTLFCALSQNYIEMLLARVVTGVFAGLSSSVILTIVTDLFAINQRGRAMAGVQMGFAVSQIMGIPAGIFIANHLGWHFTFLLIVFVAVVLFFAIYWIIKPIDQHLLQQSDKNAWLHLWHTMTNKHYQTGFMAVAFLTIGGFLIMPFSAVFLVNNVHITNAELPMVFFWTGLSSLIVMPLVGKLSDQVDRFTIFALGSVAAIGMVYVYTNMQVTPLWQVVCINILMFAAIMCRMSPAMALNTMVAKPQDRGAYMSICASLQQTAGGLASVVAGSIVVQTANGPLQHFDLLGYLTIGIFILCIYLVGRVNVQLKQQAV
jgi:predicted MFS family arabinose efflux permease